MPADGGDTAREACRLNLEAAIFLEVRAHGADGLMQADPRMAALADKFRIWIDVQGSECQVFPINSTLRDKIARPIRFHGHEGLQGGDTEFLGVNPAKHFFGLDDALERAPPACVKDSDSTVFWIYDNHGKAVGGLYDEIVAAIDSLSLAPYKLEAYKKKMKKGTRGKK